MIKKTTKQFIEEAKLIYGDRYDYSKVEYTGWQNKVIIICPKHGEFLKTPNKHLQGQGCPMCSQHKITKNEFVEKAKEIHNDKYDYSEVNFINKSTKVTIICPIHGSFLQTPGHHLNGEGCPKCGRETTGNKKRKQAEDFIAQANKIHNNKYNYSKVKYINCEIPVTIICPIHGEFDLRPQNHLNGYNCPKCSIEKKAKEQSYTVELFIERAREIHGNKYDYSKVEYVNNHTLVKIICQNHGEFELLPCKHLIGHSCPKCRLKSQTKLYEKLKETFPNEEILFEVDDKIIPWLERQRFDIYFPKYNIAVEYNGIQHYLPNEYLGGEIGFLETQRRDKEKRLKCKNNNCSLFEIKYNYSNKDYQNLEDNIRLLITNNRDN